MSNLDCGENRFYESVQMFVQREKMIKEIIETYELDENPKEFDTPKADMKIAEQMEKSGKICDHIIDPLLDEKGLSDVEIIEKLVDQEWDGSHLVEYEPEHENIRVLRLS